MLTSVIRVWTLVTTSLLRQLPLMAGKEAEDGPIALAPVSCVRDLDRVPCFRFWPRQAVAALPI